MALDQARGARTDRQPDRQDGEGTQAQAAGRSIRELERLRDDYLVAIQQVLRQYDIGAGATLRALEERLYTDAAAIRKAHAGAGAASQSGDSLPRLEVVVRPEWADYNIHMSDFRYGQLFGDAMDALYRRIGIDDAFRRTGRMFYTVESHVKHLAEAKVGQRLYVTTQLLGVDDKRLHVFHRPASCGRRRARRHRRTDASERRHRCREGGSDGGGGACRAGRHVQVACRIAAPGRGGPGGRRARETLTFRHAQDRRSRERREEIALVACQVVATHGFDQATVARIARAAGYTTGMVAHYYDSKQDIILAALRLILLRIEQRLTRPRDSGATTLTDVLSEALAVDSQRFTECAFWMAFLGQMSADKKLRKLNGWVHREVHAFVRPVFRRALAEWSGVAAELARPGARVRGHLHQWSHRRCGDQSA